MQGVGIALLNNFFTFRFFISLIQRLSSFSIIISIFIYMDLVTSLTIWLTKIAYLVVLIIFFFMVIASCCGCLIDEIMRSVNSFSVILTIDSESEFASPIF